MTDTLKYIDVNPDDAKRMAQRMHVKKDDIQLVRKGYEVKIEDQNDEDRTITARVSTADRDRDGEIVEPKGIELKDYRLNPVLGWAHKYDHPAVGKALWSKTDADGLICKFQFAETQFADELYQLYKGGFMKAFSIGFIPMEYDQKSKTHQKISLLEVSAVLVPANQNALVMEAYAKGLIKSDALKQDLGIEPESASTVDFIRVGEPQPLPECVTTTNVPEDEPYLSIKAVEPEVKDVPVARYEISEEDEQFVLRWREDHRDHVLPFDKKKWNREEVETFAKGWAVPDDPAPITEPEPEAKVDTLASEFEAKLIEVEAKLDALLEKVRIMSATPAPLADPPPSVDNLIEIDEPEDILQSIEAAKPAVAPAPEPKELTLDEAKASIASAIEGLDLKGIVDKSIKDNLDRLRGRVR